MINTKIKCECGQYFRGGGWKGKEDTCPDCLKSMIFNTEYKEYLKLRKRAEKINKTTRFITITVSTRIKHKK